MNKILIVDDDPHIRELARVFLQHGFDVTEQATAWKRSTSWNRSRRI